MSLEAPRTYGIMSVLTKAFDYIYDVNQSALKREVAMPSMYDIFVAEYLSLLPDYSLANYTSISNIIGREDIFQDPKLILKDCKYFTASYFTDGPERKYVGLILLDTTIQEIYCDQLPSRIGRPLIKFIDLNDIELIICTKSALKESIKKWSYFNTCWSVFFGNKNIAEYLISKGMFVILRASYFMTNDGELNAQLDKFINESPVVALRLFIESLEADYRPYAYVLAKDFIGNKSTTDQEHPTVKKKK